MRLARLAWAALGAGVGASSHGEALTGYFALEERLFPEAPVSPGRPRYGNAALSAEAGYHAEPIPSLILDLKGFVRLDEHDPERTRFDILEGLVSMARKEARLEMGISRLFWGVAESRHLVDVINQVDGAGTLEGDEKLGQPLLRVSLDHPWSGFWEAVAMTGFRPRPFPGPTGRPGPPLPILDHRPMYASALEQWHPDFALRWSHHLGPLDWAMSGFAGTARDPRLVPEIDEGGFHLRPRYDRILQGGLELQYTAGAWLWKLEALARKGQGPYFTAATVGLEYGVPGGWKAGDASLFLEFNQDTRRNGSVNIFDKDLFSGLRVLVDDPSETTLEAGTLTDLEEGTVLGKAEASRRFGDFWLTSLEARYFLVSESGYLEYFRRDHFLELEVRRVF